MKLRLIFIFLLIFFIGFFVSQGIYLPKDSSLTEEKLFTVERGQNLFQIAENLEKEGLIKNRFLFDFYVFLKGRQRELQAGEYFFSPSISITEVAEKIISGDTVKETITIPEGWNLRDIAWYFENRGMFQAEELFELVGFPAVDYSKVEDLPIPLDFSSDYDFLKEKPKNIGIEGYLFPDTYQINRIAGIEEIVRKLLSNFDEKLAPYRNEISGAGLTLFDTITMASLLEKEVNNFEECQLVSGILWKRLKNGVPLQVDATINYITGKQTIKISKEETQIDSPYNTYKYPGLPIGPICNPGLGSIEAALSPESSEYWYYLSTPEGETIFSKTLEEHNIAKQTYLK